MKKIFLVALNIFIFFTACNKFIIKDTVLQFNELEKKVYVLQKDIKVEGKSLKKGQSVKIIVSYGDDYVKVHAYPSDVDELKAERVLIQELYLFNDDFPEKIFNMDFFTKKLFTVLK